MTAPLPSPTWQPAKVRTIAVPTQANLRIRGLVPFVETLSWVPKSSASNLDFTLDPTAWLADTDDYLLPPQATVTTATGASTDLTVLWVTLLNGMAVVQLGGGAPGTTQSVLVKLETQQGRTCSIMVEIAITLETASAVASAPSLANGACIPPNAIRLPDGSILTTDTGSPILIA